LKEKIEGIGVFDKNEDRLYEKIQRAAQRSRKKKIERYFSLRWIQTIIPFIISKITIQFSSIFQTTFILIKSYYWMQNLK